MESLLNILIEEFTNERLDSILYKDSEFIGLQNDIEQAMQEYDKLNLDSNQKLIIDRMVSACNASGAYYGMVAYRQGIYDCVQLLKEMKIL